MNDVKENDIVMCDQALLGECDSKRCTLLHSYKATHLPDWCDFMTVQRWWTRDRGHLCDRGKEKLIKLTKDGHWIDSNGQIYLVRRENES